MNILTVRSNMPKHVWQGYQIYIDHTNPNSISFKRTWNKREDRLSGRVTCVNVNTYDYISIVNKLTTYC